MRLKVGIFGAPSSRKSTVASGLESKLKQDKINAEVSKEYARQYIQNYGVPVELASEFVIYRNQTQRDMAVAAHTDVMISDTPAMNCYIFGRRSVLHHMQQQFRSTPTLEEKKLLQELHEMALNRLFWFDIIYLFPPTGEIVQDGVRQEDVEAQLNIFNAIKGFMDVEGTAYQIVDGSPDQKIDFIYHDLLNRGGWERKLPEVKSLSLMGSLTKRVNEATDRDELLNLRREIIDMQMSYDNCTPYESHQQSVSLRQLVDEKLNIV